MLTESLKPLKTLHFQLPSAAKPVRTMDSSRAEIRPKSQHFGEIQERYETLERYQERYWRDKPLHPKDALHCLTSEAPAVDHHTQMGDSDAKAEKQVPMDS